MEVRRRQVVRLSSCSVTCSVRRFLLSIYSFHFLDAGVFFSSYSKMAIAVAEPPRCRPVYRQARQPEPQTVNPAQLVDPSGSGAPLGSCTFRSVIESSLHAPRPADQSQKTRTSPFRENGRPGRWTGSTGYPLYFVKQQLEYRGEGISIQPESRYEPEPPEPLFGMDYPLTDLPSPPSWTNVQPRPREEMLQLSIQEVLRMPVEEFMMRYCPDKPPITDQQMIDGVSSSGTPLYTKMLTRHSYSGTFRTTEISLFSLLFKARAGICQTGSPEGLT